MFRKLFALLLAGALAAPAAAVAESAQAPWGKASAKDIDYSRQEVVFDVAVDSVERLSSVLDRASYISKLNGANPFDTSVVLVLHGNEIPFFAIENFQKHKDLMKRANSLTMNGVIEFRMCEQAASFHGYKPGDIHGFVTLVPMAEAEIIRYQQKGYAYLKYK
ncbi:DsrE family protein [Thiohalorhabdus sp. Cl-TMA]|uniref:DsrE family protein n=1 Tax=Thiohalorhabdus methylotrophus TaxID=3242694 RepID=A0ABV4TYV7_9GAMM